MVFKGLLLLVLIIWNHWWNFWKLKEKHCLIRFCFNSFNIIRNVDTDCTISWCDSLFLLFVWLLLIEIYVRPSDKHLSIHKYHAQVYSQHGKYVRKLFLRHLFQPEQKSENIFISFDVKDDDEFSWCLCWQLRRTSFTFCELILNFSCQQGLVIFLFLF